MNEEETFLSRWSRLKRESPDTQTHVPAPPLPAEDVASPKVEEAGERFDPATLPSIESITADTDIAAFLREGVPAEVTKAALRRAWLADPAIREFVGIAENQWDFTKPDTIHGFGPLKATDDVEKLVAQALGISGSPISEVGAAEPTATTGHDVRVASGAPECVTPEDAPDASLVPQINALDEQASAEQGDAGADGTNAAQARRQRKALRR